MRLAYSEKASVKNLTDFLDETLNKTDPQKPLCRKARFTTFDNIHKAKP